MEEGEQLNEMTRRERAKELFGRFKRKKPTPEPEIPSKPPKPRDPEETPRRRFLRRLDELYPLVGRVAAHGFDANVDPQDIIEEIADTVHTMYHKKEVRKERKERGRFRGEEDTH